MALTHDELYQIACRFLQNNGFKVAFHDRFVAYVGTGEQPDAIGFRNLASCLIEVKCSRSDFLADKKKPFRRMPSEGMGDWRFFMAEPPQQNAKPRNGKVKNANMIFAINKSKVCIYANDNQEETSLHRTVQRGSSYPHHCGKKP